MIIIQKIKKHFSETFATEKKEGGLVFLAPLLYVAGGAVVTLALGWFAKNTVSEMYRDFVLVIGTTMISIGNGAVSIAGGLLTHVTSPNFTNSKIVEDPVFNSAWASVRDLSNMLIVLGFVVVGIATTLRFREYEAKKLLVPLIGVALLINFSGLMCQTIINGADLTTTALLQQGGGAGGFTTLTAVLTDWGSKQGAEITSGGQAAIDAGKVESFLLRAAVVLFFNLFAAWIFFILACLLAARYAVLAVFYILSPIAFVAFVFPATKPKFKQWWDQFIQWSLLSVLSAFFIYLAMNVIIKGAGGGQLSMNVLFTGLIFLYIGYKMARSGSAAGSAAILGMAIGGAKLAAGAVGTVGLATASKALKGAGSLTRVSKAGTAIGHGVTRGMERMGIIQAGTVSGWENEKIQKDKSKYEKMSSRDLSTQVNARGFTSNGRKAQDIQAQILAERGDFDKIDPAKREAMATRAINGDRTGAAVSAFRKADPRYAALDKKAIKDKMSTGLTEQQAKDSLVGSAFGSADVEARSKFAPDLIYDAGDPTHKHSRLYLDNTTAKQMSKAGERMSEDRKRAHKELIVPGGVIDQMLADPANAAPAKQAELHAKHIAIAAMS